MAALEGLHALSHRLNRMHLTPLASGVTGLIRFVFGAKVPATVEIGHGTFFSSGGIGTVVHRGVKIGENCIISSCVTLGASGSRSGVPVIQDGCFIGAGARVLGPVCVGSGSVIGANAVVVDDIPPRSVAVGVPARVIKVGVTAEDFAKSTGVD